MRGVFVGQTGAGQTSGMRCRVLQRLGHQIRAVDSSGVWQGRNYAERQLDQLRHSGPGIARLNEAVQNAVDQHRPEFLWAEKQEHLEPDLLAALARRGITTIHYNPDPYFTLSWKRTPQADRCLALYDVLIVTKQYELHEYRRIAKHQVIYSALGYDSESHRPMHGMARAYDVTFIGGWEPRREQLIRIARQETPSIAIWGYGWRVAQQSSKNPLRALRLGRLTPGRRMYWGDGDQRLRNAIRETGTSSGEIYEQDYRAAVGSSAISLGFLRQVCPDQHTTRSFEIPAMGGFMLADRSAEHLEFFVEGKEAEFFASEGEYLDKLRYYLANESARQRIARAGYERCISSGYSYDDRLREAIGAIDPALLPART